MFHPLIILTGASGSGKTSILAYLKDMNISKPLLYFHFDSIGVPSLEEMNRIYGSTEEWQRNKTSEWIEKIKTGYLEKSAVLLEGQMRISFLNKALTESGITLFRIVLVDCNDKVRRERLTQNRQQPDLANDQMMDWARFLRKEAQEQGVQILDTSFLSLEQSALEIIKLV